MTVISAWQIYLVLQLDTIGSMFAMGFWFSVLAAALTFFIGAMATECGTEYGDRSETQWANFKKAGQRLLLGAALCGMVSGFMPSTKTAAAMFVIPAIVNNETLQKEAGELYTLAKRAMTDALGDENDPAPSPKAATAE